MITFEQGVVFAIILFSLVFFIWGRWRYDVVALSALILAALTGVVPMKEVFVGFGHPAVITVAAVLIISEAAMSAGLVDIIARLLLRVRGNLVMQIMALTSLVTVCSAFMNNVGALALMMPVAIWLARRSECSPGLFLMPLAFGSLLGGMLTLIGTPPNIVASQFLQQATGRPFAMFDFFPVGLVICVVGVGFISLVGWRLIPKRGGAAPDADLFSVEAYMTEVVIVEGGGFVRRTLHDLLAAVEDEADISVIALIRGERRMTLPSMYEVLRVGDILMIEASSEALKVLLASTGVKLVADVVKEGGEGVEQKKARDLDALRLAEVVVLPKSMLVGMSVSRLALRERYGLNVLAVARQGQRLRRRMSRVKFVVGDILLIQGKADGLADTLRVLGCLPLAARALSFERPRKILITCLIFLSSIGLISFGILPAALALVMAALCMVLFGVVAVKDFYKGIDLPVIVLLAAMIPVGGALETTGGSQLIAKALLTLTGELSPVWMLGLLMSVVMALTNVINNTAAVILAAPIALKIAEGMDYPPEPLLMAVAVASSSAFLTPIGHQSNTLVMAPGGYAFSDYWRMGLPLSILVLLVSIPAILWVFPI